MIKEEAIRLLSWVLNEGTESEDLEYHGVSVKEALKMAVKALEQEPCEDAISRQAAINAMLKIEQEDIEKYGCSIPEGFDSKPAIEALNDLVSVKTQPKIGDWTLFINKNSGTAICSYCLKKWKVYDEIKFKKEHNFCPNCGTKMKMFKIIRENLSSTEIEV